MSHTTGGPEDKEGKSCLHCKGPTRPLDSPRGLCRACHRTPGIRDLYPVRSKPARGRCNTPGYEPIGLDKHPTNAPPGTEAKLKVMCRRAMLGLHLFHPLDNRVGVPRLPRSSTTNAINQTD